MHGWSWPAPWPRRRVSILVVLAGCAGAPRGPDAAAPTSDGSQAEAASDAAPPTRYDALAGLASGATCDSSYQCLSNVCLLGKCSDWSRGMRIVVDATATGANIRETIANFPLLVRLRAGNFDFASARFDGGDLRFVDASSKDLGCEIESWDPEHAVADVWVLVPRIEALSAANTVTMYWGNPLAAQACSGPQVFGAFTCTMHMGADPDGVASHLQDSSGQGNTGLLQEAPTGPPQTEGIAGNALSLDGKGTYLSIGNTTSSPKAFSIALWLKTSSTPPAGIAGLAGKPAGPTPRFDRAIWMDELGRLSFGVAHGNTPGRITSLTGYADGAWHHVVARFGTGGQYLFVDGESIADDPTSTGSDSFSGFWRFGQDPTSVPSNQQPDAGAPLPSFAGSLDEIRIATSELNDAWIKLSYETQRPTTRVMRYLPLP